MSSNNGSTQVNPREVRGLEIAATKKIRRNGTAWLVPSQSSNAVYRVALDAETPSCNCPDHQVRRVVCKHIIAAQIVVTRETDAKGRTKVTKSVKVTYRQEWSAYNAAQTHEREQFVILLRSLCDGIEQPVQAKGRPRLPLSDTIFSLALKTYSTLSGRRADGFIREAQADGLLGRAPSYNSAFRYLESMELTPLLKWLIEESAKPLRSIESDFAVDSSGFSTATYERWFDHKWGKERSRHAFVKTHLICGVTTNIVTSVEATPTETADAPMLGPLVRATAKTFAVSEVSGDKAYSSKRNLRAVQAVGGTAFIPFKQGTMAVPSVKAERDDLWARMWGFFTFNRAQFMEHYHKRSNVESTFSMIKAKFGGSVRAKTPVAQVNEVLLKVLCHNLVVLVQCIYELGIAPTFFEAESSVAPNVRLLDAF